MSEADVRAEVIDPLLRRLGYSFGADNYIHREQRLQYPYVRIGRKSKKDIQISGFPDYICGITGRRGRFIVEAKSERTNVSKKDVEQAHSYAAHPEVQANFIVLCNGDAFLIYETMSGPDALPIVQLQRGHIDSEFHKIEAILRPDKLSELCHREYDLGLPISRQFGSRVRITRGVQEVEHCEIRLDGGRESILSQSDQFALEEHLGQQASKQVGFRHPIVGGICQRNSDGKIVATLEFGAIHASVHNILDLLGVQFLDFETDAQMISEEPNMATLFETSKIATVRKGSEVFEFMSTNSALIQFDMTVEFFAEAYGCVASGSFAGGYCTMSVVRCPDLALMGFPSIVVTDRGSINVALE